MKHILEAADREIKNLKLDLKRCKKEVRSLREVDHKNYTLNRRITELELDNASQKEVINDLLAKLNKEE